MSARTGYGQRRVYVTPEAIEGWLVNEEFVRTNLPDDARFVRMYPEEEGRAYVMVFESEEWEELAEGEEIPKMDVTVEESTFTFKIQ